ncbi:MAG TPA: XdhC family protein [Thermoflexales bacterium]|nr:XdhC family protein [Thermoflexales bacterium]HQX12041.1 XdhC family protein [Thermoflexales bacterium]HQZ52101.1 XdhC family protein [Thermoflexales bacterium]
MSLEVLELALATSRAGTPCALCTVIQSSGSVPRRPGSKMLVGADGAILAGTIGGGAMEGRAIDLAREAIADGEARTGSFRLSDPEQGDAGVCGGTMEVFIEPLASPPTVLVVGAGHVGRALVKLATFAGFRAVLSDDRVELCAPAIAPGADAYLAGPLLEQLGRMSLSPRLYVALVTRGYAIDVEALPVLLRAPVAYIGVIGSRRRWLTAVKSLREAGISDADLARVRAPIGLEIRAETPEEIAVSIMADIIATRRGAAIPSVMRPGLGLADR